jgi:hypothetical protein
LLDEIVVSVGAGENPEERVVEGVEEKLEEELEEEPKDRLEEVRLLKE